MNKKIMKVSFTVKNFKNLLPKSNDTTATDFYSLNNDPYILIGFNETVSSTKLIKIPLSSKFDEIYTIIGNLQFEDIDFNLFSCIISSLYVPILKHGKFLEYSRQGKELIYYLDELKKGSGRAVTLKTKDGDTMCTFDIQIVSVLLDNMDYIKGKMNGWSKLRSEIKSRLKGETEYYKQNCIRNSDAFGEYGIGMERYDTYSSKAYDGERPTNSFLFFELQDTNEKYWMQIFNYVMTIKKTELGMSDGDDSTKLFFDLSTREKMAVYVDLVSAISVNTFYLSDYVLKPNGKLRLADDYSTIDEGSGDCEDHALSIIYNVKMFQKCNNQTKTGFGNKALSMLYTLSSVYDCGLTLCALNGNPSGNSAPICHMAILFLYKPWLLSHIYTKTSEQISKDDFENLKMYENDITNDVKSKVDIKTLPSVLFGEGTAFLYPYQTNDYMTTNLDKKEIMKLKMNGIHKRLYQSEKKQYHLRYILFITNSFICHPASPVNIPSLYFTYNTKSKDGNLIKGVVSDDLYEQNFKNSNKIVLIPQTQLKSLKNSVMVMKFTSSDKFGLIPLFIPEKTDIPLGRYEHDIQQVTNYMPNTFKGYNYIITQSKHYNKLAETLKSTNIVGVKTVRLTNELVVCIIWIKNIV